MALLCLLAATESRASDATDAEPVVVRSPDGRLAIELSTRTAPGTGRLQYRVALAGHAVVDASSLGVRLADGTALGRDSHVVRVETADIDSSFEQFPGKRRHVIDRATEVTITLRERGSRPLEWQLVARAYDDGVALRYRFPQQPGWGELEVADELTEFAFPATAIATPLPLAGFTTSHEARYERLSVAEIPADWLLGLPLLVELPGVGWAAVLEANLTDYAGMYLARGTGAGGTSDQPALAAPGRAKRRRSARRCRTSRPGG